MTDIPFIYIKHDMHGSDAKTFFVYNWEQIKNSSEFLTAVTELTTIHDTNNPFGTGYSGANPWWRMNLYYYNYNTSTNLWELVNNSPFYCKIWCYGTNSYTFRNPQFTTYGTAGTNYTWNYYQTNNLILGNGRWDQNSGDTTIDFWKIGGILAIRELSSNELKRIVHPSSNFGLLETPIPDLLPVVNTVGADPYINPIYGNKYKLPDRGDIYRFLDNNDFNNRFLMNIQCWDLPNDKKIEIKDYIYNQLKWRYQLKTNAEVKNWMAIRNIAIPKSAVFIRYLFISNNNRSLIFDLEKFIVVNKKGEILENNKIPKIFSINNDNVNKSNLNILAYDKIQPDKELKITTITKTYGKVTINLMKYSNPQIRNAYNIKTEIPITRKNSRGALLGNQEISNILVNNLNNNDIISEFKLKATDNLKELFINEYGKHKLESF